jgi:histone deacetylase 11
LIPFFNEFFYNTVSNLSFNELNHKKKCIKRYEKIASKEDVLPIVYDSRYNVTACGIEKAHPFDSVKYGRVFEVLNNELFMNHNLREVKP